MTHTADTPTDFQQTKPGPTILDVGFKDFIGRAVGLGIASDVAQAESPWASSPAGEFTLDQLYKMTDFVRVNERRASQLSVVGNSARIVGSTIGRMPLYSCYDANGKRVPLQPSLLRQPERGVARSTTLRKTAKAVYYHPATWWLVTERDYYGWPMFVRHVPQHEAITDDDGRLVKAFGKDVRPQDVIDFVNPDGGLLHTGENIIRRSVVIERAAAFAEANPVPSINLEWTGQDQDDAVIDRTIQRWREAREKGGIGFTGKGLKATPMGVQPEQLLIDGRKTLQLEQARLAGIPAWALDVELAGTSLNYSNNASRWRDLLNLSSIADISTIIKDRLSLPDVTAATQRVEFDTDQFTRDDQTTRFGNYKTGKDGGFITNEWIAEQEGWDTPAPEGSKEQ